MSDQPKVDEFDLEDYSDLDIENEDGAGEENDTPEGKKKKNSSNFKNLYKKTKEQEAQLAEKERELEELRKKADANSTLQDATSEEKTNLRIFGIEQPEAKEHLAEVLKVAKAHNFELDQAWAYLKQTMPKESSSYDDFSGKGKKQTKFTDYKNVSLEESASLSKEERAEWRKANNMAM